MATCWNGYRPICVPNSNADYIYKEARKVLATYVREDQSDQEKVKFINDWIIHFVTYDYEAAETTLDSNEAMKYSAFYLEGVFSIPGFTSQVAVCDGRSKAVTLLCAIEGINSVRVTGEKVKTKEGHAWNRVYVGNNKNKNYQWYVLDTTWNDVFYNGKYEVSSNKYYLVSDSFHDKDFMVDKTVIPLPNANTSYARP